MPAKELVTSINVVLQSFVPVFWMQQECIFIKQNARNIINLGSVWFRGSNGMGWDGPGIRGVWMRGSQRRVGPETEYSAQIRGVPVPRNRGDGGSPSGTSAGEEEEERRCARSRTARGRGWEEGQARGRGCEEERRRTEELEDEGT